jgi:uncharacterized protein (DUF427 family)
MAQRKFGAPRDVLRYEPSPRRVRARLGGATVVDSYRPLLVWPPGWRAAIYAVPVDDVDPEALRPADRTRAGAAETWDVVADGRGAAAAAWRYEDPDLVDHLVLDVPAFDVWLEEEEELRFYPQDPFHRVDVRPSSRHVAVDVGGTRIADSSRIAILFETGLPLRAYLPPEDVRMDLLQPSDTRSKCPYKGEASYWSATAGGTTVPDVAWTYADPTPESERVRGLVAFWPGRAEVRIDGELID